MEVSTRRDRWTEAEVAELPVGEHDYFDRKSGLLFQTDATRLLGTLAKALSAFSNSGGGHLILGVADDGSFDGVPRTFKGTVSTREWLEQKVPNLLTYPLADFRVHAVERDPKTSAIPVDRDVLVIDVGDSALAPHQCLHDGGDAIKYLYYMRQGGHSVPAPHFYVELLRQRLTNAALTVTEGPVDYIYGTGSDSGIVALLKLVMTVENVGRVAAYKWAIQWRDPRNLAPGRWDAYAFFDRSRLAIVDPESGLRVDDTILPGGSIVERFPFTVRLSQGVRGTTAIQHELWHLLEDVELDYRIATETGIGDWSTVRLGDHLNAASVAAQMSTIAV
jgi:Putative DNA-binding domain